MFTSSGLRVRKHIRLRGYEYGGGAAYHITICAFRHRQLFGRCENGVVTLSDIGSVVQKAWLKTPTMRPDVVLDVFKVMPDHLHGILHLAYSPGDPPQAPLRRKLFRIIGGFKSGVTSAVRSMLRDPEFEVWQPRFNDRIIRNDQEMENTRKYIDENPVRWWCCELEDREGR